MLIVDEEVHWLVLKVECLHRDNRDEDQNLANQKDVNKDCEAVKSIFKLQLLVG